MEMRQIKVLLVAPGSKETDMIAAALFRVRHVPFSIVRAFSPSDAAKYLSSHAADVVLLDLGLSGGSGLADFERLSACAPEAPFILLSPTLDESQAVKAVQMGAQDYLVTRGLTSDQIVRSVLYSIERHRMHMHLKTLSTTDDLTGLNNRRGFILFAGKELKIAEKTGKKCMLSFIDIDGLKQINDIYGHREGDNALVAFSRKLRKIFRDKAIIGRIGGDEFTVFSSGADDSGFRAGLERLKNMMDEYNQAVRSRYMLSVSIGIATSAPPSRFSIDTLLTQADRSMYRDKEAKRLNFRPIPAPDVINRGTVL